VNECNVVFIVYSNFIHTTLGKLPNAELGEWADYLCFNFSDNFF